MNSNGVLLLVEVVALFVVTDAVVSVDVEHRKGNEERFTMPTECPRCATKVVRMAKAAGEVEAATRCPNAKCPARHTRCC